MSSKLAMRCSYLQHNQCTFGVEVRNVKFFVLSALFFRRKFRADLEATEKATVLPLVKQSQLFKTLLLHSVYKSKF
jgi:hypothetical protein